MKELFHFKRDVELKDELQESQKRRLQGMRKQTAEHDSKAHADFMDKVANREASNHLHRMEHHGEQYWRFFGSDEERLAILNDEEVGEHDYGTRDDHERMETTMLSPNATEVQLTHTGIPIPDVTEELASHRLWWAHQQVGQLALARKDYADAERNFRLALHEAKVWGQCVELSQTVPLLVAALNAQGKTAEAQLLSTKSLP